MDPGVVAPAESDVLVRSPVMHDDILSGAQNAAPSIANEDLVSLAVKAFPAQAGAPVARCA
jgi:hypothetical protein